MKLKLLFTNDWELFGEGSGNFHEIQETPLRQMWDVFAAHQGHFTLFTEIGQQWAHRELGQREKWAKDIADRWESLVRESVSRGHDAQLHLHPTWLNAKYQNGEWQLDFSQWQLVKLGPAKIEEVLRRGIRTLEETARTVKSDYKCLAFRAGAFCIQPESETWPAIQRAGIRCDSSVVPGFTDHIYFDFRRAHNIPGSYKADPSDLTQIAKGDGVWEFPIHTERIWDFPILRRSLPKGAFENWKFNTTRDLKFEQWSNARDERARRIYPAARHPLKERGRALRGPSRWAGYACRRSPIILDYDFLSPGVFVSLVERAVEKKDGDLTLVALGHAKNMHTAENLDRILHLLKNKFGQDLQLQTVQQAATEHLGKS